MSVGWLLDACVFEQYHDELAAAIVRHGHQVQSVRRPKPPYTWDDVSAGYRNAYPAGACVITHGDIDLVQRVRSDLRWTPGVFATVENFFCSRYVPHFQGLLLNQRYSILPFGQLSRQSDHLFDTHGRDGRLFVRPDSPLKLFTGQIVSRSSFEQDLEYLAFSEFSIDSLVVVSSPQTILREWRFVIANQTIVAASQYKEGDQFVAVCGSEPAAQEFAQAALAAGYSPDAIVLAVSAVARSLCGS